MKKLIVVFAMLSTSVAWAQVQEVLVLPAPSEESASELNTIASRDSAITINLQNRLQAEGLYGTSNVSGSTIQIETRNGMVYLSGTVKRQVDAERAANIARTIEGVIGVNSSVTLDEFSKNNPQ